MTLLIVINSVLFYVQLNFRTTMYENVQNCELMYSCYRW